MLRSIGIHLPYILESEIIVDTYYNLCVPGKRIILLGLEINLKYLFLRRSGSK